MANSGPGSRTSGKSESPALPQRLVGSAVLLGSSVAVWGSAYLLYANEESRKCLGLPDLSRPLGATLLTALAVCLAVWVAWTQRGSGGHHGASTSVSRERLAEAEEALEDALRAGGGRSSPRADERDPAQPHPARAEDEGGESGRETGGRSTAALALPELWAATHARLDHYHAIATEQAQRSFKNAQRASVAGFGLLVLFLGVALAAGDPTASLVAGGLGAVSAALAGFVSRTFVRSQEAAAGHLRSYFDQPLELSRFLAAERLIAGSEHLSETQRGEVFTAVAQAMVTGPPQAPTDPIPSQRGA